MYDAPFPAPAMTSALDRQIPAGFALAAHAAFASASIGRAGSRATTPGDMVSRARRSDPMPTP
jgi:hypothetical protein